MSDFERLLQAGAALPRDNTLALYEGDGIFRAMWEAIDRASTQIWLETYIYKSDGVGRETLERLTAAAHRGCEVVLLYDAFGSIQASSSFFDPLREAGGTVIPYNPLRSLVTRSYRPANPLHRDHRKLLIVDGAVGFTGGANISEAYAGEELGIAHYTDLMLRVEGSAVRSLAHVFASSVEKVTGRTLDLPNLEPGGGERPVRVFGLNDEDTRQTLSRVLMAGLEAAEESCLISTPYFIPPPWFQEALTDAAERGVEVCLLTAGDSEIPLAREAGRYSYEDLLQAGVRIFELREPVLHAKYITIDGAFNSVGSYNFDRWSNRHNLEVNVATSVPALSEALRDHFERYLPKTREVELESWRDRSRLRRPLEWGAHRVSLI